MVSEKFLKKVSGSKVHVDFINNKCEMDWIEGILEYEWDEDVEEHIIEIISDTDLNRISETQVKKIYLKEESQVKKIYLKEESKEEDILEV